MENKYSLGKVYEIVCNITGHKYVGSTCEDFLSQRLANHRGFFKRYKNNFKNEKKQNYSTSFKILEGDNYYINLLEKVNATCKDELLSRERYYINTLTCVNKCIPLRTKKEYYYDNIKEITEKKSLSNICECGGKYRTDNKVHHFKSNKHNNFLEEKEILKDLKHKGIFIDLSTNEKVLHDYALNNIAIGSTGITHDFGFDIGSKGHNGANGYAIPIGSPIELVQDYSGNTLKMCKTCNVLIH